MLSLLGRDLLLMDSKVFLPKMTVFPCCPEVVIFLNMARSLGRFHGSRLSLPMPRLAVLAMTRSKGNWRISSYLYYLSRLNTNSIIKSFIGIFLPPYLPLHAIPMIVLIFQMFFSSPCC